jgi:murein L,D-transpeptidase YafK
MNNITTLTLFLVLISQVFSQNRKDLIWEYNKLVSNDYHLGILLDGNITSFSNQEIQTVLDDAWSKKKSIVLLQLLGFLENPACELPSFSDFELNKTIARFKSTNYISHELAIGKSINQELFNHYLNSNNESQLPYLVQNKSLNYRDIDILFIAYKSELEFQVWAKKKYSNSAYTLIKSFPITNSTVAKLGPKSKFGDSLTPEGIYSVTFYSSLRWSDFYLAFRISYPNKLDHSRRSYWNIRGEPGGDINIHGCCISIGCIPLGNPVIEEIFFLTRTNQINGSNISIMIFPFKFDNKASLNKYYGYFRNKTKILEFWNSLGDCYNYFKTYHKIPEINLNQYTGYYILNGP